MLSETEGLFTPSIKMCFGDPITSGQRKYGCKWGLKHFEVVHFPPLPEVVENTFDRIDLVV